MTLAEHGFLRWFFWALFSWRGRMKRVPYAFFTLFLLLLQKTYLSIAMQVLAVYIIPPPDGGVPTMEYAVGLGTSLYMVPMMLPLFLLRLSLDVKRLRSIGAPLLLAPVLGSILLFSPIFPERIVEMANLTVVAYIGILAIIPSQEDRMHPLQRKARTWRAIATGDGTPVRLSGKDIKGWRIARQGPAK